MASEHIFSSWWQALVAVPSTQTERDWWAQDIVRHPRYSRLLRVWGDPTDSLPPPFYKLTKEKHLVPALWENMALFSPASLTAELYSALGFAVDGQATDICWSCEFNLGHRDRQLDLVIHVRFSDRDEVVIGEAKARRKAFDEKDLNGRDVLSRPQFRFARTRRYFLIGDAQVPADWHSRGYGHISWRGLGDLQLSLCNSLLESHSVQHAIRCILATQYAAHNIAVSDPLMVLPTVELKEMVKEVAQTIRTAQCRNFVLSALQHIECLAGIKPAGPPFPYLSKEPTVDEIKPGWQKGCGCREVNEEHYWELPGREPGKHQA